jgi:hypothetical protein
MTTTNRDARDQQARWDDWSIAYARSDRRQRLCARVVAVLAFTGIAVNLAIQLWSRL